MKGSLECETIAVDYFDYVHRTVYIGLSSSREALEKRIRKLNVFCYLIKQPRACECTNYCQKASSWNLIQCKSRMKSVYGNAMDGWKKVNYGAIALFSRHSFFSFRFRQIRAYLMVVENFHFHLCWPSPRSAIYNRPWLRLGFVSTPHSALCGARKMRNFDDFSYEKKTKKALIG